MSLKLSFETKMRTVFYYGKLHVKMAKKEDETVDKDFFCVRINSVVRNC